MLILDLTQINVAKNKGMAVYARNVIPRIAKILKSNGYDFRFITLKKNFDIAIDMGIEQDKLLLASNMIDAYIYGSFLKRNVINRKNLLFLSVFPRIPVWNQGINICTIHDITAYKYLRWYFKGTKKNNPLRKAFTKKRIDFLLKKSNKIAVVSHTTSRDLQINYFHLNLYEKLFYVGNGATHIKPSYNDALNRQRSRYFLYIGGNGLHKNLVNTIKAFRIFLDKTNLKYKLLIAGSFKPKYLMSEQIPASVKFLGPISEEEKRKLIENATSTVYLSIAEGFGIPPLESILLGTPVILSNIEIFNETLYDWRLKVDPFDPFKIAETMANMVTNQQEYLEEIFDVARRIESTYTWDQVAMRYFKLINNI